jgi:tetratricopeptide (TPR) repeat protein
MNFYPDSSSIRPPVFRIFVLLGFIGALTTGVSPVQGAEAASSGSFPRLEADPRAGELNLLDRDGVYSWQALTDIALWASGGSAGGIYRGKNIKEIIADGVSELKRSPLSENIRERGEYVLTFMYDRYLKKYSTHQTRVDEIFISGQYNCVSSAVLYSILALSVGLDVRGVMTRDHAFVTVHTGAESIDVETTNPYGFDPGSRREFHDAFGTVTGFAYVPARNYRDRAAVSQLELASLILSNRIAELESRSRYPEAVPLAVDRAALLARRTTPVNSPFFADPNRDLLDRIFNYGASFIKAGRETDALAWCDTAWRHYGATASTAADPRWQEFTYAAVNNYLVKLLKTQQISEARTTLTQYTSRVSRGHYNQLNTLVVDAELLKRISGIQGSEDAEAVLRTIAAAETQSTLSASRAVELRNFILIKEGERLAAEQGPPAAIAYTEAAITRYGRNARLEEALRVYRFNRVADLHNSFAGLFNRREYESAREFLQAALTEFPGNRQLTADLNLTEQALRRQQ